MEIKQKDGSRDRLHTKVAVGASDAGITLDGPLNKDASFIVSFRQSYLQWLFKAIGLPFLPTYNDFQMKYKWRINPHHEITVIGIGAIDNMSLNRNLEQTGTEAQKYILGYLPEYLQWNYTFGLVYKHYGKHSVDSWILSRNMLRNAGVKYKDNDKSASKYPTTNRTKPRLNYATNATILRYLSNSTWGPASNTATMQMTYIAYSSHREMLSPSNITAASTCFLIKPSCKRRISTLTIGSRFHLE